MMIWHSQIFDRERVPQLDSNTVHVWSVSMGKAGNLEKFAEVLSPEEIDRAGKFQFERHRLSAQAVRPIGCAEMGRR